MPPIGPALYSLLSSAVRSKPVEPVEPVDDIEEPGDAGLVPVCVHLRNVLWHQPTDRCR